MSVRFVFVVCVAVRYAYGNPRFELTVLDEARAAAKSMSPVLPDLLLKHHYSFDNTAVAAAKGSSGSGGGDSSAAAAAAMTPPQLLNAGEALVITRSAVAVCLADAAAHGRSGDDDMTESARLPLLDIVSGLRLDWRAFCIGSVRACVRTCMRACVCVLILVVALRTATPSARTPACGR